MSISEISRGEQMYALAKRLWRHPRSITGEGVRASLAELSEAVGGLVFHEVATGTQVGDWVVPNEWNLRRARLIGPDGTTICDTSENNLHVLNYSLPFNGKISLEELQSHIYSLPEQPDAIPYVTSYYEPRWGFSMSHTVRQSLQDGEYLVQIDASLAPGSLTYADLILPGENECEILISTYVCHPQMANNELSGPVVTAELIKYLKALPNRQYTYRFVFAPETIGAITYIHRNHQLLKDRVKAGFVVTCVGDDRAHSLLPTRNGDHHIDVIARHVLSQIEPMYKEYPWASRGSDERQYSAPLVGIPMVSVMRSKYYEYSEYHTSHDDLERVVSAAGLAGGFEAIRQALEILEQDVYPTALVRGEPMLSALGLYSTLGAGRYSSSPQKLLDIWSFCDGSLSTLDIATKLCLSFVEVREVVDTLLKHELVQVVPRLIQ